VEKNDDSASTRRGSVVWVCDIVIGERRCCGCGTDIIVSFADLVVFCVCAGLVNALGDRQTLVQGQTERNILFRGTKKTTS
jgi:hypothetical protein